ncbi:MAG: GIY-YIG nuclease family protein, partial [Chloroflexota bacterium]
MTYNVQPGPGRGTYILILWLPREERMAVGRLGTFTFPAGTYVYVGSAMGPGGLAGRLRHHRRPVTRPHWHVDYLRQRGVELREVWGVEDDTPSEHEWARQLAQTAGV